MDIDVHALECLQEAIYHEARGEDLAGQLFVGFVIRNRVKHWRFPNDVCSVVQQPWQFSYHHVLPSTTMYNKEAAKRSKRIAYMVLSVDRVPISKDVLYYHATYMTPDWDFTKIDEYEVVGNHVFYEDIQRARYNAGI